MRNFIPERMVRATGRSDAHEHRRRRHLSRRVRQRRAGLDPDVALSRSATTRASRRGIYGSEGAHHLPAGRGVRRLRTLKARRAQTTWSSREIEVPAAVLSARRQHARSRGARSSTPTSSASSSARSWPTATSNEGNFDDGAWVQEIINAVEQSFRERRWVTLPLRVGSAPRRPLPRSIASSITFYRRRPVSATFTGLPRPRRPPARLVARRARCRGRRAWRPSVANWTLRRPRARRRRDGASRRRVDLALADAVPGDCQIAEHASGRTSCNAIRRCGPARRSSRAQPRDARLRPARLPRARRVPRQARRVPGFLAAAANVLREAPA